MKVCIVVPTEGKIEPWCEKGIKGQTIKNSDLLVHKMKPIFMHDNPFKNHYLNIVRNRNSAREEALKKDADWFLWVDSDVAIPPKTIEIFLSVGADLMGGWYKKVFESGWISGVWADTPVPKSVLLTSIYPAPGIVTVDMIGLGCAMMKREVLERVRFDAGTEIYLKDRNGAESFWGDCLSFCEDAKKEGIQSVMVGDIICEHLLRI